MSTDIREINHELRKVKKNNERLLIENEKYQKELNLSKAEEDALDKKFQMESCRLKQIEKERLELE